MFSRNFRWFCRIILIFTAYFLCCGQPHITLFYQFHHSLDIYTNLSNYNWNQTIILLESGSHQIVNLSFIAQPMRQKAFYSCFYWIYFSIFQVVASGMNLHLSENELIRSIFSLGDPLPSLAEVASNRPSKHERVSKKNKSSNLEHGIYKIF